MDEQKPLILITNDDGIDAPGIFQLYLALKDFATTYVVAPASQQSCKGLSITLSHSLNGEQILWKDEKQAWKIFGTPADCTRLALSQILPKKPDLIVSGINRGCNSGRNVLYSGTIGAVIEGIYKNIPGIAFSCRQYADPKYHYYDGYILQIVKHFLKHAIPKDTLINVNFPECEKTEIQGIKYTRQGLGYWIDKHETVEGGFRRTDTEFLSFEEHPESDITWLAKNYITATPLQVHCLTALGHLEEHKDLFESSITI